MADGIDAAGSQDGPFPKAPAWRNLKRSWWILFTLVPFGWLAFVTFFYAGHKAKRTDWKLWAVVYFLLSWVATVVASVQELSEPWRQAGGMVMLFVVWPSPFVHALLIRRTYLERIREDGSPGESASREQPAEAAWQPEPRSRWMAVTFLVFVAYGLIMTITGTGADRLWGAITLLFFGAGAASLYIPKGDRSGVGVMTSVVSHHERHASALVFPHDSRRHRIRLLSGVAFAVAGLLMFLFADDMGEPGSRYSPGVLSIIGLLLLVTFGGSAVASLRRFGSVPRLALLDEGVLLEAGAKATFVPWDAIEGLGVVSMHRNEMLGISVRDRKRVETSPVGKLLLRVNAALSPAEITQPLDAFVAPAEVVVTTVEHYFTQPEERPLLETGEARSRVPGPQSAASRR